MKAPLTDRMARCLIEIARDGIEFRGFKSWRSIRDAQIEFYNQTVQGLADRGFVDLDDAQQRLDRFDLTTYGKRQLAESCRSHRVENPLESAA